MSEITNIYSPLNEDDGTKAVFSAWLKNVGDRVQKDESIAELETDKVTLEIHAPHDGVLTETLYKNGDNVEKDALLAKISKLSSNDVLDNKPTLTNTNIKPEILKNNNQIKNLSPAVRRLVKQYNINPNSIKGSGRDNRVTKSDILEFIKSTNSFGQTQITEISESPKNSTLIPHSNMRRKIAQHMQQSVTTAPHVTAVFEADLSAIIVHRKHNKPAFEAQNINLSLSAYFIAATVEALKKVPNVNSRWHDDALEAFNHQNIGIGTSLGNGGLIVPVIQNAQNLNLLGIAKSLQTLTQKARDNKLTTKDLKGGTFTISNHGTSGSLVATPIIINQPQSAILGIGKMQKRPIVVEVAGVDALVIKPMCYISLTIDHRALDGHQTNQFLTHLVSVLESW